MALYTKKLIMSTFQEMLEEMPFDKITVSALVKRAEISPNTFYYHYQDIYALLDVWFRAELGHYFPQDSGYESWKAATKAMLWDCKEHSAMIYHLVDSRSRDRMERYIYTCSDDILFRLVRQAAGDRELPPDCLREIAAFCRCAYIGFVMKFFWNRMEGDIDGSVDRLGALMDGFVTGAVEELARGQK